MEKRHEVSEQEPAEYGDEYYPEEEEEEIDEIEAYNNGYLNQLES